jgi:hypothetical protein
MNESERRTKEYFERQGWIVTHTGAPDFVLARSEPKTELAFCEVKRPDNRFTSEQEAWRAAIQAAGIRYYLAVADRLGRLRVYVAPYDPAAFPGRVVDGEAPYFCPGCGHKWVARVIAPLRCPSGGRRTARPATRPGEGALV